MKQSAVLRLFSKSAKINPMKPRHFRKACLWGMVLLILLSGCGSSTPLATNTPPPATSTLHTTAASVPTWTPLPTATPTRTLLPVTPTPDVWKTPTIPPEARLRMHCLDIAPSLPPDAMVSGTVVLKGFNDSPSYLLDMETGVQSPLPKGDGEYLLDFTVSPDGKWLAYRRSTDDATWLVITTADGSQLITFPWEEAWLGIERWLDENRISLWGENWESAHRIILNPFNGEHQEISGDYPDMDISSWPPVWGPVYDPTLTRVVYPRLNGDEMNRQRIVLWDLQANQAIAYLSSNQASIHGSYGGMPVWAKDGQRFIMALDEFMDAPSAMELYSTTREGKTTRLTNLTSYYSSILEINRYAWSPDEKYIAFWLNYGWARFTTDEVLAVLDMETLEVTNYCIPNSYATSTLVWSPDGKQLALRDINWESEQERVILVDIIQGYAAGIAIGEMEPVDWMVSP
jgi:dipeptidyl aminopeptidase/acylaminoacyl peptidase